MTLLLAAGATSVHETEKLVSSTTLIELLAPMAIFSTVITAPFMRLYFRKIGYKYELLPDV